MYESTTPAETHFTKAPRTGYYQNQMVIDFHAHIYPEKIAEKALANVWEFYKIPMRLDGTVHTLLENGRSGGIDRFVVFSPAAAVEQVRRINDFIAAVCCEHPELAGFGTLHPAMQNPGEEIKWLMGLGLRGITCQGVDFMI